MSESKYDVGYKQPPVAHQFRSGQSGNPAGRPKDTRSLKSDLRDELAETIQYRDGNREVLVTKQRALVKALVDAAVKGDGRSISTILTFCERAFSEEPDDSESLSADDREFLDELSSRTQQSTKTRSKGNPNTGAQKKEQ